MKSFATIVNCFQPLTTVDKLSNLDFAGVLATTVFIWDSTQTFSKSFPKLFGALLLVIIMLYRSSYRRCSTKKGVLKNFAKFIGKHLCQSLIFNNVVGLKPTTLLKKRLWTQACIFIQKRLQHNYFPVNFAKIFGILILQSICQQFCKMITLASRSGSRINNYNSVMRLTEFLVSY